MRKTKLANVKPPLIIIPVLAALFAGAVGGPAFGISVLALLVCPVLLNLYAPPAKTKKLWFKRKRYGWGWYPASKEGWFITGAYIALIVLFALTINTESTPAEVAFTFGIPIVLLSATFIRIAYRTGETPRWQWGKKG